MKILKICVVFLLCALLAGCAARAEEIFYHVDNEEELKAQQETNRDVYRGKTMELTLQTPETFTLESKQKQRFTRDDQGTHGDLPWLYSATYFGEVHYKFPYSDKYTLKIPADSPKEEYGLDVACGATRLYAKGAGVTEVCISDLKQCKLKGKGVFTVDVQHRISDRDTWASRKLTVSGRGEKRVTVEFTEKGAVVKGIIGKCKIVYHTGSEMKVSYDSDGKAFEVDVISQPGEILVTPIEG